MGDLPIFKQLVNLEWSQESGLAPRFCGLTLPGNHRAKRNPGHLETILVAGHFEDRVGGVNAH